MPALPPYRRIADDLRTRIASGELAPGDAIPSARRIVRDHGVALATASKVLAALRDDGLVRALPGVGMVVVDRPDRAQRARAAEPASAAVRAAPALTTEDVVDAAIRLADEDGLAGLSMRRIAAELGVATMSLYPRVRGKEDLLVSMVDAVFAEYPPPSRTSGTEWRKQLEAVAHLQWNIYLLHSWMPSLLSLSRPQNAPHGMRHTEALLQAFDGFGLSQNALMHAAVVVAGYVRGCAIDLEAELRAQQDTGLTADQWIRAHGPAYDSTVATGGFPMLAAVGNEPVIELSLTTLFEFGLQRLLDGFATWLHPSGT
ncbi:TetR/AcrR family transcriptional regulator C-terminal domain-containing protein [Glaciibacter flavus]|uniref:TetR/AcrR family transcriptional regulator C-terminal domain-containing protein n=1 Tax=Orlajensenia flava TaxID=2565934 RepID=UPI003AFFA63F